MNALPLKVSEFNTNPFDDWFFEEKGSGIDYEMEGDVDESEFDSMVDKDDY